MPLHNIENAVVITKWSLSRRPKRYAQCYRSNLVRIHIRICAWMARCGLLICPRNFSPPSSPSRAHYVSKCIRNGRGQTTINNISSICFTVNLSPIKCTCAAPIKTRTSTAGREQVKQYNDEIDRVAIDMDQRRRGESNETQSIQSRDSYIIIVYII